MRIIGCDLHARQQTIAMLGNDTSELATSPGAAVTDAPESGADHRVSYRSVPGRSAAIQNWLSFLFASVRTFFVSRRAR
jgi:hypothetical protein